MEEEKQEQGEVRKNPPIIHPTKIYKNISGV